MCRKEDVKYKNCSQRHFIALSHTVNATCLLPALRFSLSGTMLCHGLDQEGHYKLIHQKENDGERAAGDRRQSY